MSYTIKNFFTEVNKKWLRQHKIPQNNVSISYFDLIEKTIEKDLIKLIHAEVKKSGPFSQFLQSFYNGRTNDLIMLEFFADTFSNFNDYEGLYKSIGLLNLYSIRSPITIDIGFDPKNTNKYTIFFIEPTTGIEKQDYEDKNGETYKNYKAYLHNFGKLLNFKELETQFIDTEVFITKTYNEPTVEIEIENNPMTFQNLTHQFKHINFGLILDAHQIPKTIQEATIYSVKNLAYMKLIDTMFKSKSLEFWKIWIKSCVYADLHQFLSGKIRLPYFNFYDKFLNGQQIERSEDKQIVDISRSLVYDNLGQLYIQSNHKKFKAIKDGATKIIKKVKQIANERIMRLTWLSESSRLIACRKMECMSLKVAYPETWFDEFKGIKIDSEQFLLNVLTIMKNQTMYQIEKLKHQKKDNYWDSACFDVNAYYYSELNMFCIPIGFLFPPFYGEDMNFVQIIAGLGNIVGHEISHGFDKDGRKYDEFGNNYPWWTSLDVELYKEKTQKIIKLFNDAPYHGLQVDGELTLDENLADFGALAITLDVLHAHFASKSLTKEERKTQLREFFIWYSKTWCYKATRAKNNTAIKVNVHAPPELRVNALLPHFDEFYEAFDFDEAHEGFIPKSERIDVWG